MMRRTFLGLALAALAGCGEAPPPATPQAPSAPVEPVLVSPEIAAFYHERGSRPLWVTARGPRPEALRLAEKIAAAADHGLDPRRYGAAELRSAMAAAADGQAAHRARAELLLSRAYTTFAADLRAPGETGMARVEAGMKPAPPQPRVLLEAAASAPDLRRHLAAATSVNPLYDALARGHAKWRALNPARTAAQEALVRANLGRARAVSGSAERYVIVDSGSARLWTVDKGKVGGPMRVIVGKPSMQTPAMAGMLRYAVVNPYWNVPPDLARERARRVLGKGVGTLRREGMDILSDWGDRPRVIGAAQVDWKAVAAGRKTLRLRQRPGGANVMGKVKFMMPNPLGIYLHDFPDKSLFARADRRLSSGCVRLEDAEGFARWLFRGKPPAFGGPAERRVDLAEPVPVYIVYLTVLPDPKLGLTFQPDGYRRERWEPPRLS